VRLVQEFSANQMAPSLYYIFGIKVGSNWTGLDSVIAPLASVVDGRMALKRIIGKYGVHV
jgi:hypothetical protein